MTLAEAKTMLERQRIPFETAQYENEAAYWHHTTLFPYTKYAKPCPVTALVIPSVNGCRHIELQFNRKRGDFHFTELWFGGYDFEMFDHVPDLLEADILETIGQIVDGKLAVILAHDLGRKQMAWGGSYDLAESDDVFGSQGFRARVEKINRKKTFLEKLLGKHMRYEIYTWKTYKSIEK